LFPGLAVAERLRRATRELRITFAGTGKAFETQHVRDAGYEYLPLACRPFPRRARDTLRFLTDNLTGYYVARRYLNSQRVSLVVGLGGFVSVPAARAAASLAIPCVLLEQNAVPGRATRWLAPGAALVCSAFEDIAGHLRAGCRVRVTGNPLRPEFFAPRTSATNLTDRLAGRGALVVLGGSGGAATLNQRAPLALYKAGAAVRDWQIVHQTGQRDFAATTLVYRKLGIKATVVPFVENLSGLLRTSRLAISRAGGTTLAELAASGVPAILLPYPQATDDHQLKNAEVFAAAGGARLLDERQLSGRLDNHLASAVVELATNPALRGKMASAIARLARPQATARVTKLIGLVLEDRQLATG
jgi:UDP-N-acetylglucosamine--N-acetylmuramyl-(pentapeptide) pyrophosphoryl-undecaprenol N-acetylglucosamine transferase